MAESKSITKEIKVKSDKVIGSLYAQVVGVIVTDLDITLEFIYVNPRPDTQEGEVISRITLPRTAGEGLVKNISNIIAQHEAKRRKKNE
jgi:hypothetical protein